MIINANSLHIPLANGSVQTVVTSPPYYGLRDYGVPGQLGLEPTPEEYIANMVAVFSEVKRVLRDDGTLWLNIGDSYAQSSGRGNDNSTHDGGEYTDKSFRSKRYSQGINIKAPKGCKPKDLIGIPWMLAFALRADGWYLRSDIIWAKPNPMPESVTDRPTKAHEYVFLLTKSPRYYWDAEAVKEKSSGLTGGKFGSGGFDVGRLRHDAERERPEDDGTRNIRTVWTIATQPTKEAHFATYPEKLVEPCILAGTSARGCCPQCGAAWERVVEREIIGHSNSPRSNGNKDRNDAQDGRTERQTTTTGWQPACQCNAGEPVPCRVLDPFSGSGTTGRVALRLGRRYVGLELNWKYITEISPKRLIVQMGMGL